MGARAVSTAIPAAVALGVLLFYDLVLDLDMWITNKLYNENAMAQSWWPWSEIMLSCTMDVLRAAVLSISIVVSWRCLYGGCRSNQSGDSRENGDMSCVCPECGSNGVIKWRGRQETHWWAGPVIGPFVGSMLLVLVILSSPLGACLMRVVSTVSATHTLTVYSVTHDAILALASALLVDHMSRMQRHIIPRCGRCGYDLRGHMVL